MKLFFYISSLILLTCFSACKRPAYPLAMQQAEELMNTRPDSALHILEGMADSLAMLSDEAQMYYHLLTIQAKDKQYITHPSDSLIAFGLSPKEADCSLRVSFSEYNTKEDVDALVASLSSALARLVRIR